MDVDVALVTEIDRRKDNFLIFSTGKTLNKRFTTKCGLTLLGEKYKKQDNEETNKRRAEMETLKELEEGLRLFSKRRRAVSSPEANHSAEKTKPFSTKNLESTKKQIKQELSSYINEFSLDDYELKKPVRKPEINSSEVTLIKKKKQISRGDLESIKPYKLERNCMDVTSSEKVKRIPFGDFEFTKPLEKRGVISSDVSSNETTKMFSTTDLESVKPNRKKGRNVIPGRKVEISSIGCSKSTKPICDESMNRFLSDDFDLINAYRKKQTNYFEVSSRCKEVSRISSDDSKLVEKFTNHEKWGRFQSSKIESISNSDYNLRKSSTFIRPWSYRNNYVSSATETEYFRSRSYGFRRNKHFNSPYHYRKNFREVHSYSWNSLDQRNHDRLKEQLDDEIDQYMSEIKLKPTSAKEEDLDSFVEEYFMETEKVLRENDYVFDSQ